MPGVLSKKRRTNINPIENQAVVALRLQRWQDGDICEGSMDNYVPKQREFINWCMSYFILSIFIKCARKFIDHHHHYYYY